jgi:hypothetical protein
VQLIEEKRLVQTKKAKKQLGLHVGEMVTSILNRRALQPNKRHKIMARSKRPWFVKG